jgi:hypothetical protein
MSRLAFISTLKVLMSICQKSFLSSSGSVTSLGSLSPRSRMLSTWSIVSMNWTRSWDVVFLAMLSWVFLVKASL